MHKTARVFLFHVKYYIKAYSRPLHSISTQTISHFDIKQHQTNSNWNCYGIFLVVSSYLSLAKQYLMPPARVFSLIFCEIRIFLSVQLVWWFYSGLSSHVKRCISTTMNLNKKKRLSCVQCELMLHFECAKITALS